MKGTAHDIQRLMLFMFCAQFQKNYSRRMQMTWFDLRGGIEVHTSDMISVEHPHSRHGCGLLWKLVGLHVRRHLTPRQPKLFVNYPKSAGLFRLNTWLQSTALLRRTQGKDAQTICQQFAMGFSSSSFTQLRLLRSTSWLT